MVNSLLAFSFCCLSVLPSVAPWLVVSVADYGAVGDNETDNSQAFLKATAAVSAAGGGEVIVPALPAPAIFKTGPFNLTSNVVFTVAGTVFGLENASAYPVVPTPPSYLSTFPATRFHPLVWAPNATNVTIRGSGELK